MNIGLYQNAASLSALERWQDSVAQNIASSQLTGYRKHTVNFSTQAAGELQGESRSGRGRDAGSPSLFPKVNTGINFTGGDTQPTLRELDAAIQGDGFFEVQRPDGSLAYTRNGEFRTRPDRTVITAAGDLVLTEAGTPIVLLPGGGPVTIDQSGGISQGDTTIGKLAVRKFADNAQLIAAPGGLFLPGPGVRPQSVENVDLMQGYLEGSNVTPMREMVDLILISRAYEANQKIISTVDQRMQKTLEALG